MAFRIGALAAAFTFGVAFMGDAAGQKAIATANSDAGAETRVELMELKRTGGDTVTMKAVIVNDSTKAFNAGSWSHAYLLDTDNKKKLTVARDEKRHWLGSHVPSVRPHSKGEIWAKFAAPPESVQKVTVVIPKFSPMEDIDISK